MPLLNRLIVIGASTGGVDALRTLFDGLPRTLEAAVLVVQHVGGNASQLPQQLSLNELDVRHAAHGERLANGTFLVAPPDCHLLVEDHLAYLSNAPKEHYTRPAIDPLFRSAALAFGGDVIGVVLTGVLDDGTAGLQAIKALGGVTIVQDPADARAPEMPRSALENCEVDHCVPIGEMASLLCRLVAAPRGAERIAAQWPTARAELPEHEMAILQHRGDPLQHLSAIGAPTGITCPDCQGVLWALKETQPLRFRCHTGHAYTARTLDAMNKSTSEDTLWKALRGLQERRALLETIARHERRERHGDELAREIHFLTEQEQALRELIERSRHA